MDRVRVDLSEGPVAPAHDTNIGRIEYLLFFDSFSDAVRSVWNTSTSTRVLPMRTQFEKGGEKMYQGGGLIV